MDPGKFSSPVFLPSDYVYNQVKITVLFDHSHIRDAMQMHMAGMFSMADEQFHLAKIYMHVYFIVDQPGGARSELLPEAG
jgi:hypothetical protein